MPPVLLAAIRPLRAVDLTGLDDAVRRVLRVPVRLGEIELNLGGAYDPARRQYHSATLLAELIGRAPAGGGKILGVTGADLFAPVFEFLFGEAQLGGAGALVSIYRLRHEAYGLPPDPAGFAERLIKEAVHELGHALGLVHCFNPACVMNPSTFVEQIDAKPDELCAQCEATRDRLIG
jgi:archaemetzincin